MYEMLNIVVVLEKKTIWDKESESHEREASKGSWTPDPAASMAFNGSE